MMKQIRVALWILVALAAGIFAILALSIEQPSRLVTVSEYFNKDKSQKLLTDISSGLKDLTKPKKLGAPFTLQSTNGETVTDKDLLGEPHLIFFGFTHCPEICPTTLYETSGWMEALGDDAKKLKVYFVTVDPERDTQEVLANYLSPFGDNVIGLTGSLEEMNKAAKGFHVYYKKVPLEDGGYTMDHTASIYLIKPDGTFQGTIAFGEDSDTALNKIRRLLKS